MVTAAPRSAATELSGHRLQAGLEALVSQELGFELAYPVPELAELDAQTVSFGDFYVLAENHPVGCFERRPTTVWPARLERAATALAKDTIEGPHLTRGWDPLARLDRHQVGELPAHEPAQLFVPHECIALGRLDPLRHLAHLLRLEVAHPPDPGNRHRRLLVALSPP